MSRPACPSRAARRRHDWPERLAEMVTAARDRPFAWGRHDCALFACDCIEAMTGVDPAAPFRGRYRSAGGAGRALRRIGRVSGIEELATKVLGAPRPTAQARRGDVVLLNILLSDERWPALGVVLGVKAVFPGADGLEFHPVHAATKAWWV